MALSSIRVQFTRPTGSYRANEIGYFTQTVALAIVDAGNGVALDTIPSGTAHVLKASTKHMAKTAREAELIGSESDRQLVAHAAAPVE